MFERIRRVATVAGAAAMLLVVAGNVAAASPAKLTAVVATDDTGSPAAGMAWIRVLHASPDAPAVDVYVDGAKAITDLAFGSITDYTPVAAGSHAIKVCATGSTTVCPIDVPALAVADGMKYTIAATDELAKITAQVITDAPSATLTDSAQVRVVHFSADTPAVDVLTADGASKLVTNLAYPNASSYLSLPASTYSVKVCAAPGDTVCPLGPLSLTVANGKAYSVFAVGSLTALLATPAPSATPAASMTPPPTSTLGSTGDASTPGSGLALGILALAFVSVLGIGVVRPLAARRARR